ncbi:MAG: hypothetical protein J2P54_10685 [Bradyrhizobiaceae bacterium]|nr:hypothetical protein [Bradyrhizobiaceae bacterium]
MAITSDMPGTFRLGEVFSTSFNAFRRHVVAFIILTVIAHLILPAFTYFVLAHYPGFVSLFWGDKVLSVADFLCVFIAYGAIIYAVIQDLASRPVSMVDAVGVAARHLSPLVGVLVCVLVAAWVLIWLVTLLPVDPEFRGSIVPWMYILVTGMFFVVAPVCIAEKVGLGSVLSRCRFLTKGHRWQISVAILLVGILEFAICTIWAAGAEPLTPTGQGWAAYIMRYTVGDGIWFVLGAYNAVLAAVLYDKLRLAKDGVHLAEIFD